MSEKTSTCPPFLEPRLRLFLSADIIGSTSLKQTRMRFKDHIPKHSKKGPAWFSAIQGFYFEAAQEFFSEWEAKNKASEDPNLLYGSPPTFWKSIGDEVLFTKILTDHRQLITTLQCWFEAVKRMRSFLKTQNNSLDVKCTAWVAGFPFRNREVVIGQRDIFRNRKIEDYYLESGNLLNEHYKNVLSSNLSVDYIGPSIDTGFRLTSFSSGRKMSLSIDVAYIISMTNFDGEIDRLDLFYDGLVPLKGVLGGSAYPLFWLNMGGDNSLAVKEDKLKAQTSCNREDVKEFCDSFYGEYEQFTFRPFIKDDAGRTFSKSPDGYNAYHALLVKNFIEGAIDYSSDDSAIAAEPSTEASAQEIQDLISDVTPRKLPTDKEQ